MSNIRPIPRILARALNIPRSLFIDAVDLSVWRSYPQGLSRQPITIQTVRDAMQSLNKTFAYTRGKYRFVRCMG